jgi:hypothetical protein
VYDPRDYITAWRAEAPWVQDFQVEQNLVISRALVEIFSHRKHFVTDRERHSLEHQDDSVCGGLDRGDLPVRSFIDDKRDGYRQDARSR